MRRDEALAELVERYFTSHGPATFKDFAWWWGLTARDAAAGVAMIGRGLVQVTIDGLKYWFTPGPAATAPASPAVFLLPIYDSSASRIAIASCYAACLVRSTSGARSAHLLVIDRELAGRWRRLVRLDR